MTLVRPANALTLRFMKILKIDLVSGTKNRLFESLRLFALRDELSYRKIAISKTRHSFTFTIIPIQINHHRYDLAAHS